MIKIERVSVMNLANAIRGARNPLNSWARLDSTYDENGNFVLGPNDLDLARRLAKAGSDHRKFLRQIFVSVDITAPLYWWKEFDTYKVGTVANSTSTMHKITSKEFVLEDFSCDHLVYDSIVTLKGVIDSLNRWRDIYINGGQAQVDENDTAVYIFEPKDKNVWWQLIQLLPSSYNQTRTVSLNYEVLRNIYNARRCHKLTEWRKLCKTIEDLPLSELITNKFEYIDGGE